MISSEQVRGESKGLNRLVDPGRGVPRGDPTAIAARSSSPPKPPDSPLGQEQSPAALGFAGQRTGRVEDHQIPPALPQTRSRSRAGRGDEEPCFLMIPHGRSRGAHQNQGSRLQVASGAIARRASTHNGDSRRVHPEPQFGAGPADDFDRRAPGSGQSGEQETMPVGPLNTDANVASIQPPDQLFVDPVVVSKLGYGDRGVHRTKLGERVENGVSVHRRHRPGRWEPRRRRRLGRARPVRSTRGHR